MIQEFGTPTGPQATLSKPEMRDLFLNSEYPAVFQQRNPKGCTNGTHGCDSCDPGSSAPKDSVALHRFCRCMMAADFLASGEPAEFEPFSSTSALRNVASYQKCSPADVRDVVPAGRRLVNSPPQSGQYPGEGQPPCFP